MTDKSASTDNGSGTMGEINSPSPPPPSILKRKRDESSSSSLLQEQQHKSKKIKLSHSHSSSPSIYSPPSWAELPPKHFKFELEVIKNGVSLKKIPLQNKSYFIFGRDQQCVDIFTAHPSCSRYHAVLQHRKDGEWLLFDFGSTHFTKLNHKKILSHKYYKIKIGANLIQFGTSQRMYILNGPKQFEHEIELKNNAKLSHKNVKNDDNKMEAIIKELAKHSTKTSKVGRSKLSNINVWGLNDTEECNEMMEAENLKFDEDKAQKNKDTKALFLEWKSKRKQFDKMEKKFKLLSSKQRSDKKELSQSECIKLESLRLKMDKIEDNIELIASKIAKKLNKNDDGQREVIFDHDMFDDNDDFYDRSSHRQQQRQRQAMNIDKNGKSKDLKTRSYKDYKIKFDTLEIKISEIEQTLRNIEYRKQQNIADRKIKKNGGDNEEIESILNDLRVNDDKYKKLKRELNALRDKKESVLRMINILRPAFEQVMVDESQRVSFQKYEKISSHLSKKSVKPKQGSLAEIALKVQKEREEKAKNEQKIEELAKQKAMERERKIKEANDARLRAMKEFEREQKEKEKKRKERRMRDEQNKNKVGLVIYEKDKIEHSKNNKLESAFAEIIKKGQSPSQTIIEENVESIKEDKLDLSYIKEADAKFIPPSNQTGDGKTWLNEKFGY